MVCLVCFRHETGAEGSSHWPEVEARNPFLHLYLENCHNSSEINKMFFFVGVELFDPSSVNVVMSHRFLYTLAFTFQRVNINK